VLGLERAGAWQAKTVGLRGAECSQLDAELVEVEGGDLLVEVLGQDVDLVLILAVIGESSIWASTWLVKEALITKLGSQVA